MNELKAAVERVIRAFEVLGTTTNIVDQIRAHRECEAAMAALKKAWESS